MLRFRAVTVSMLVVLGLALAGCGDGDGDGGGGGEASATPEAAEAVDTFVGTVEGTDAYVAVTAPGDGRVLGYVCDNGELSTWFKGEVSDGAATLTATGGATLEVTLGDQEATGTVTLDGQAHDFTAEPARDNNAGLYRAEGTAEGVDYLAGWVVLPDGTQRGALLRSSGGQDEVRPAPELDPTAQRVSVDNHSFSLLALRLRVISIPF